MCGACGTGRARGPWEDVVAGRGPRELAARTRALQDLLTGLRWRVAPWGVSGYTVTRPTGATFLAPDLDAVTDAALAAGWEPPATATSPAVELVLRSAARHQGTTPARSRN
ncbi:hypothetical protein AB1207_02695 [Kineococcus endophyticus]|uniref:Uncharacterized protein n=1 Tax=Kineococcus endophyticus TaxID=1181883 RepID=A0ABV3P1Z2_9ACTN